MSLIKLSIKHAFSSYRFYLVLILTLGFAVLGIAQARSNIAFSHRPIGGINLFIIGFIRSIPITTMIPFLSMISCSDTLFQEMRSGVSKSILNRVSFFKYLAVKGLCSFGVGGLSIALALSVGLGILCIYDPTPSPLVFSEFLPLLNGIYGRSILVAVLIFIFNSFLCSGIYSFFTMSLLVYTKKPAFAYLFPLITTILSNFIHFLSKTLDFDFLKIVISYLNFDLYNLSYSSLTQLIIRYGLFIITSILLLIFGVKNHLEGGS